MIGDETVWDSNDGMRKVRKSGDGLGPSTICLEERGTMQEYLAVISLLIFTKVGKSDRRLEMPWMKWN